MTTPAIELARHFERHFRVLILDNEVTVDAFVTDPPLPWARLMARDGAYRIGDGYPTRLTAAEAAREELNWDRVSEAAICEARFVVGYRPCRFGGTRPGRQDHEQHDALGERHCPD